jgi:hypothetical protein
MGDLLRSRRSSVMWSLNNSLADRKNDSSFPRGKYFFFLLNSDLPALNFTLFPILRVKEAVCHRLMRPTHKADQSVYLVSRLWLRGVILLSPIRNSGPDSSVGIATRYGLNGLEIESRWRRDFPQPSRSAVGPTEPPVQWVAGLLPEDKAAGGWRGPSSAVVNERVELYVCSPLSFRVLFKGELYLYLYLYHK